MRTLTLARMGRALMIAAAMIMLPQLASAQLPVATKELRIQQSGAGSAAVIFNAPASVTEYTLTLPAAVGAQGSFLYGSNATGTLAWSDAPTGDGFYPRWDDGTKTILWTDPAGADNPNWSLTGNNLTTDGFRTLGFPAGDADISIETDGTRRIGITDGGAIDLTGTVGITGATTVTGATVIDGVVTINEDENNAVTINGGTSTGSITLGGTGAQTIDIATGAAAKTVSIGSTNTTSATNINAGSGGVNINGATTQTGAFDLAGAASPLELQGLPGTAGDVLVSAGTGATPEWQSIEDAVGIRAKGRAAISANATEVVVTGLTGLTLTDVITFSIEGGTAAIFGVLTARDDDASATGGAGTGFTVTLSGAFAGSGHLNYLVQTP